MPLGESLVSNGVITKSSSKRPLRSRRRIPKEKIGEILLRLGFLPMEELKPYL